MPLVPDQLLIRDVKPNDFEKLYDIDRICFPDYMAYSRAELRFYLRHPFSISRLAEFARNVIGFAIGRIEPGACAHIITLDVVPGERRRKVGSALMEVLHAEFRRLGAARVMLEVDTGNETAQSFYLGLGYERRELLRGYYDARSDAYRMMLIL